MKYSDINEAHVLNDERTIAFKRLKRATQDKVGRGLEAVADPSDVSPREKMTLLMYAGREACVVTVTTYVGLQLLVMWNHNSSSSICHFENTFSYSPLAKIVTLFTFLSFALGCSAQVYYIFAEGGTRGPDFTLHLTTLTINFIAGSSSFLTYFFDWGGICRDQFDVTSPASQWPEWITSVPLLVYVALSIDSRRNRLRTKEKIVVIAMILCIFSGFMLQLPITLLWSSLILVMANMCILATILMIHRDHKKEMIKTDADKLGDRSIGNPYLDREVGKITNAMKTRTLTYLLFFVFPIFPLVYLLAMMGFLDYDQTLIGWQIAGLVAKLMFCALAVRSHKSVVDNVVALVDAELQPMIQKVVFATDLEDWGVE